MLLLQGSGSVGKPNPSPLLLLQFPVKPKPCAALLERVGAAQKLPYPGTAGKAAVTGGGGTEGEGRGKARMITCFGKLKKSLEAPTGHSACMGGLVRGRSLEAVVHLPMQHGWLLPYPLCQILDLHVNESSLQS